LVPDSAASMPSQLGGYNKNAKLSAKARKAGQEANARKAASHAADRSCRRPAQRHCGPSQRVLTIAAFRPFAAVPGRRHRSYE
jgi:hypothetical protein